METERIPTLDQPSTGLRRLFALPLVMLILLALFALGGFAFGITLNSGGQEQRTEAVQSIPTQTQSALTQTTPRAAVRAQASDFTLRSVSGETVTLSGLRGKPVLLFFWTTF